MLGLLNDVREVFALVFNFGHWLLFGAFLVSLGGVLRPWVGLVSCAGAGAVLMFLAITQSWLSDDSDRVARLEAVIRAKTAQLAIAQASNAQLEKDLADEAGVSEHNAGVIATLKERIEAMKDGAECGVPKEFTDDLKKLR